MNTEDHPLFETGTPGVDPAELEARLRRRAATRAPEVAAQVRQISQRFDLARLQDEETFLHSYIDLLRELHQVDINDFPITSQRGLLSLPIRLLKRLTWNLLKFYTYRLFSQQTQINGQLVAALEGLLRKSDQRVAELEHKISALETRLAGTGSGGDQTTSHAL